MKRKEVLIIFILAILVTMGTSVWDMVRRDSSSTSHEYGFPIDFLSIGWFFITNIDALPFVLDVLFWFLVLAVGWWVVKKITLWYKRENEES